MKKGLLTAAAFACALTGLVAVACDKTEKISYKFDTMCDGEVSVQDITVKKGEELSLPTPPSRGKEWSFAGWYLTSDLTGSPVTSVVAEAGATYYAKWDKCYKLSLDLNGGTLAGADELYLKEGDYVKSFLEEYVPDKGVNYQFGQWLLNGSAIGNNTRMPAGGLTLTAQYKVAYTLDVYTQNLEALRKGITDQFDKKTETLYSYVSSNFQVDYVLQGFSEVAHDEEELSGKIVENPTEDKDSDNRFAIYFNRNEYTVRLNPNVPATSQQEVSGHYYYDEVVELPYDLYRYVGYVFAGWSKSTSGENDYPINYIDAVLYNEDGNAKVERAEYRVSGDETLYAYWNKGYTDMFGGADTIFLMDDAARDIYLLRGGEYFKGSYTASNETFIFRNKAGKIVFDGKLVNEDSFCYYSAQRASVNAPLYTVKDGINEKIHLKIGTYDELHYDVTDENNKTLRTSGTFVEDEASGDYIATFEPNGENDMAGKTVHFRLRTTESGRAVFMLRNDEEFELGTLARLGLNGSVIDSFRLPIYSLTLDGYGYATYYSGTTATTCLYAYDEEQDAYLIVDSSNSRNYVKLVSEGGREGYMFYFPDFDESFGENGELTLDGIIRATYVSGSTSISGYYTLDTSYFGGYIVTLVDGNSRYKFLLRAHTEGSGKDAVTTYTLEEKLVSYAEYLYYEGKNASGRDAFYYPMLVLDEDNVGEANLYVSDNGVIVKAAKGTYALDAESGLYMFTVSARYDGANVGSKIDLVNTSAMLFRLDTTSTARRIYYPYSLTDLENNKTLKTKTYDPVDKNGHPLNNGSVLVIVGGIAVLSERNNTTYVGTFEFGEVNGVEAMRITTSDGYIYLEVTEAATEGGNGTFLKYDSAPYGAYLYREDGVRDSSENMMFDGKGGVIYQVRGADGEYIQYTGTVTQDGQTFQDRIIYSFTGTTDSTGEGVQAEVSYRYILFSVQGYLYFAKISDTNKGIFTSQNFGTLELDGTGIGALYTDTFGTKYSSMYFARTGSIVYMYLNGEYKYFELDVASKTFTIIGSELGAYIVVDNQSMDGRYIELDGKGGAKVYQLTDGDAEGGRKPIAEGEYVLNADGSYTIQTTDTPLIGRLGTRQFGDYIYSIFSVCHNDEKENVANTYVNEADYSVLVLNDAGSAIRYLQTGGVEMGTYMLITDEYNIIYYVNNAGTYATIYEYDREHNLIVAADNKRQAYFNGDFTPFLFTQYGFAIFDGSERYYYFDNGKDVVIYRTAQEGETGNQYGFVKATLEGGFGKVIQFNGKDYYTNNGQNVVFKRSGNASEYPITLDGKKYNLTEVTFLPSGSAQFSITGSVTLTDADNKSETRSCTVVKELIDTEKNTYATYVMIDFMRYDISLTFSQSEAERVCTVSNMSYYVDAESATYYYYYVQFLTQYGQQAVSQIPFFGHITITQDYDVNGDTVGGMLMTGEFGEIMAMYDANGNAISFENAPCELENGAYTVTVDRTDKSKGGDGYIYKGVFTIDTERYGVPAYQLAGLYREQTFESNGYVVTAGRIIASDNAQSYPAGALAILKLRKNGSEQDISYSSSVRIDGKMTLIERTFEGEKGKEKITATTYYTVDLADKEIEGDFVNPYDSATVTVTANIKTVYTADGSDRYVDFALDDYTSSTNKVLLFVRPYGNGRNSYYIVTETEYVDGAYIVTTTTGAKYKIQVTDKDGEKTATIDPYTDPENE